MRAFAIWLLLIPVLAGGFTWREALPGYHFHFPRDHFEHEEFRTEWWYYTGNAFDRAGKRFGFELVFFRQGESRDSGNRSAWALRDLYLAHVAITDAGGRKFLYQERLNRAGPGVAGASFENRRIWNGNWSSKWEGDRQIIEAIADRFRFRLQLQPAKPMVIHGENGVSQKGGAAGQASHYVSFPLLEVTGVIDSTAVKGQAWMDHEWFTEQLSENQTGWDWFSVQLANGTELMLFQLRRKDGSIDPHSSGTFIDAAGAAHHLRHADFTLRPVAMWKKYPIEWRITVPSAGVDITSKAVIQDQELRGRTTYWEGAVDYTGTQTGLGYIEMTGYEGAVRLK